MTLVVCAAVSASALTPEQRQAVVVAAAARQADAAGRQPTARAATSRSSDPLESRDGYAEVDAEVGCKSTYSDDKKSDIFRWRYRDHWMTWRGYVVRASADAVDLDLDDKGVQDLRATFVDKTAGYDLRIGDRITIRFMMKTAGGCLLPFGGSQASILR